MGFEQLASLKEDLQKKAAAEKAAKKQQNQAGKSSSKPAVDPVLRTIGLLQKRFPLAFPKKPQPKVPLKIGIHKDLIEQAESLGISANEIRAVMKQWCRGKRYAECMVAGAARVDLQGQQVGYVSKDEAVQTNNTNTEQPA